MARVARGPGVRRGKHLPERPVEVHEAAVRPVLTWRGVPVGILGGSVNLPPLEPVIGPDPCDRVFPDPDPGRQRPGAPVRRPVRRPLLVRQPHDIFDRAWWDRRLTPATLSVSARSYPPFAAKRVRHRRTLSEFDRATPGDRLVREPIRTVLSGAIGSLGSFNGDPIDSRPSRRDIAKYNGLTKLVRSSSTFRVETLRAPVLGASTSARSSSWARREGDMVTLVALRPWHFDGSAGVTAYGGVVDSDVQVIVAAPDDLDIGRADELGIVPYGAGQLRINRTRAGHAQITSHLDDGSIIEREQLLDGHTHLVDLTEEAGSANVEWMQVRFVG